MPDSEDRWIPTSRDISGTEKRSDDTKPQGRGPKRFLRSLSFRRGVGAKRREVAAPAPDLSGDPSQRESEATPTSFTLDESAALTTEIEIQRVLPTTEPSEQQRMHDGSSSAAVSPIAEGDQGVPRARTHRPAITPRRLRKSTKREPTEGPSQPAAREWWPTNPNLIRALESAELKGHRFTGVETQANGTQIWRCITCERAVKHIFEQADRWSDGIGTWAIKKKAAEFGCS